MSFTLATFSPRLPHRRPPPAAAPRPRAWSRRGGRESLPSTTCHPSPGWAAGTSYRSGAWCLCIVPALVHREEAGREKIVVEEGLAVDPVHHGAPN